MPQENVEIVRRAFAEFGLSPTGVEEGSPSRADVQREGGVG